MIEVRNLSKSYGQRRAIDKLNFSVQKGEVVGFLGPNGAGKSTTMKIITGFMAPSSGRVSVGGCDVFEKPIEVKKQIGYLPEIPPVYGDMRVREYLEFTARLKGVGKKVYKSRAGEALQKAGLEEASERMIQNLSKGFRQRVGLAQALVADPDVLILDEPTAGLDPQQVVEIRELIRKLKGSHTIVLSTHILPEVEATCERLVIINEGRIVAEDTLQGLTTRASGGQMLKLKLQKEVPTATFEKIKGVTQVKQQGTRFMLQVEKNDQVVNDVLQAVISSRAGLRSFGYEALEDVFIKLTAKTNTQKGEQNL